MISLSKNDIRQMLQTKERGVSVQSVLEDAQEMDLDSVVMIGVKDGKVYTGCSHSNILELLGAISYAQSALYDLLEEG